VVSNILYYFIFTPKIAEDFQFDEHIFSDGLVQPPTREFLSVKGHGNQPVCLEVSK